MNVSEDTVAALDETYLRLLEADIIAAIARQAKLDERQAMDVYYRSKLSMQVDNGDFGIQFLSPEYLARDLIENEPELFG